MWSRHIRAIIPPGAGVCWKADLLPLFPHFLILCMADAPLRLAGFCFRLLEGGRQQPVGLMMQRRGALRGRATKENLLQLKMTSYAHFLPSFSDFIQHLNRGSVEFAHKT